MIVVILAGGLGTRLAEETEVRPKPMVDIGGWPILWHIMKGYAHHGFKDFIGQIVLGRDVLAGRVHAGAHESPLTLYPRRCGGRVQVMVGSGTCCTGVTLPRQPTPMICVVW